MEKRTVKNKLRINNKNIKQETHFYCFFRITGIYHKILMLKNNIILNNRKYIIDKNDANHIWIKNCKKIY